MIFNQKRHPKLFWVEAFIYLAIFVTCVLGSYGVFDAKAQEIVEKVDTCAEWVNIPSNVRVMILRLGMVTEIRKAEIGTSADPLIDCLSNLMRDLDTAIVDECNKKRGNEFLDTVFDTQLERIAYKCLKWVKVEKVNE